METERPNSIKVSISDVAKMIDHNLSHPTMTDEEVAKGLEICKIYHVATAVIKPYHILFAKNMLKGSNVGLCPVIGFPHGNSTTEVKVYEARRAIEECKLGNENVTVEVEMVVNIGRVLSGKWEFVENEINLVNKTVVEKGGKLRVIFENGYFNLPQIVKLCEICTKIGVAYVKTTTGFCLSGVTNTLQTRRNLLHLGVMRQSLGEGVKIAMDDVGSLEELLKMGALGIDRASTRCTSLILEEARIQGIGEIREDFTLDWFNTELVL